MGASRPVRALNKTVAPNGIEVFVLDEPITDSELLGLLADDS